jgi:hypothetical protein
MRRSLLVVFAAAVASGFVLTSALAGSSFTDPAGDATGNAPDITAVQVSNDNGGQILFQLTVANLTPKSIMLLSLDTDKNAATGAHGFEYELAWVSFAEGSDWMIQRWDGSNWVDTGESTVRGGTTPTGVEFTINKSDLGGTSGFAFKVLAARFDGDTVTGMDMAPDGVANWTYDLTTPPPPAPTPTPTPPAPAPKVVKPVFGTATTVPAKLVAGKKVVFTLAVTRSDTGAPLTTGKMICDPSYQGIVIKHAEAFTGGTAKLVFTVPKAAKGKLLKVKVTIVNGKQSATKVATYKVA